MKLKKYVWLLLPIIFGSCQIKEEFVIQKNGSGTYAVGMDMSEFMAAAKDKNDSISKETPRDTIVFFSDILDKKKDSFATLPKKEQNRLKVLRPMNFRFSMDEGVNKMVFNLNFPFKNMRNLAEFQEAIANVDDKHIQELFLEGSGKKKDTKESEKLGKKDDEFLQIGKSFVTTFSKKRFTRKLSKAAREEVLIKKDSAFGTSNQFMEMLTIKQVYRFPYRIREVSNPNAKITSDFKGVEIEGALTKMKTDLDYFDIEVVFEK
ncbi:MAG: hypothetical protein V3U92_09260 [Cellulophaga sp.]